MDRRLAGGFSADEVREQVEYRARIVGHGSTSSTLTGAGLAWILPTAGWPESRPCPQGEGRRDMLARSGAPPCPMMRPSPPAALSSWRVIWRVIASSRG